MAGVASAAAKLLIVWVVCVASVFYGAFGQGTTEAYCFEFTWLGPTFTNESSVNGTCNDIENKPSVCVDPLVYTYDGSEPNLTKMWLDTDIRGRVSCRLAKGEVCAKWTFVYNNELENVTYLCTKVTVDDRSAMTSGCEIQNREGRRIEVCACQTPRSSAGTFTFPCNGAWGVHGVSASLLSLALVVSFAFSR